MLGNSGDLPNIRVAMFLCTVEVKKRFSSLAPQCASEGHSECTQAGTPIRSPSVRGAKQNICRDGTNESQIGKSMIRFRFDFSCGIGVAGETACVANQALYSSPLSAVSVQPRGYTSYTNNTSYFADPQRASVNLEEAWFTTPRCRRRPFCYVCLYVGMFICSLL